MLHQLGLGKIGKVVWIAVSQAIKHPAFDAFFAVVVFANAIFTGIEALT